MSAIAEFLVDVAIGLVQHDKLTKSTVIGWLNIEQDKKFARGTHNLYNKYTFDKTHELFTRYLNLRIVRRPVITGCTVGLGLIPGCRLLISYGRVSFPAHDYYFRSGLPFPVAIVRLSCR